MGDISVADLFAQLHRESGPRSWDSAPSRDLKPVRTRRAPWLRGVDILPVYPDPGSSPASARRVPPCTGRPESARPANVRREALHDPPTPEAAGQGRER